MCIRDSFSNPTATARAAAARNPRPLAFRPRRAGAAQTSNSTMLSFPLKTVPTGVEGSWDSEEVVDGLRKLLSSQYGDAAARGLAGDLGVLRRARTDALLAAVGSACLLYTSPSPRDGLLSRMPSSA